MRHEKERKAGMDKKTRGMPGRPTAEESLAKKLISVIKTFREEWDGDFTGETYKRNMDHLSIIVGDWLVDHEE